MTKNPDLSLEMGFHERFVITIAIKAYHYQGSHGTSWLSPWVFHQCITISMLTALFQVDVLVPFSILWRSEAPVRWKEGWEVSSRGPWPSEGVSTDSEARNS